MTRILGRLLAAVLITITGVQLVSIAPSTAAKPDTKNCATKKEFKKVKPGMDLAAVKAKLGAKGRVRSEAAFPDGDHWLTYSYRQCGRSWKTSIISISFELTETVRYVPNVQCFDGDCYDWGMNETFYSEPFIVTSKTAYWT